MLFLSFREMPVESSPELDSVLTNDVPRVGEKLTIPADWFVSENNQRVYEVVEVVHLYQPVKVSDEFSHSVIIGVKEVSKNQ